MVNVNTPSSASRLLSLPTWLLAFFLAAIDRTQVAEGQTTDAVCNNTNWAWSLNSKKQSPCLVAAYLLAPCNGGKWTIPALHPQGYYPPPSKAIANKCHCSTVVYSLLSACEACQTDAKLAWSSWRTNCTDSIVSISQYPDNINPATAVPAWAYLDVVKTDYFDPASAIRAATLPDSTAGTTHTSTSPQVAASSSETSMVAPVGLVNKPNNTTAIIGGTVGGVLGLGLIAALVLYLLRQDAKRQAPSAAFARARATPDVAAAAGFRSVSRQANPLHPIASGTSLGHGCSNHGHDQRGPSPTPAVFQLGYSNGNPWSPPPPSSTPTSAVSPMSAQSLISTHNFGARRAGSMDYPNSSSGHGTVDLLGHSGSVSSMRSTVPMMQYAGTPAPPLATSVPSSYPNTRPTHPYGTAYGGRSGSYQSQFSGLPEI